MLLRDDELFWRGWMAQERPKLLRRLARRFGPEYVEDAVSDACARVFELTERPHHPYGFLARTAWNRCCDYMRVYRDRVKMLRRYPPILTVDPVEVDGRLDIIKRLPVREQALLWGRAEGFTVLELADQWSLSPHSVNTTHFRAVKRLRALVVAVA